MWRPFREPRYRAPDGLFVEVCVQVRTRRSFTMIEYYERETSSRVGIHFGPRFEPGGSLSTIKPSKSNISAAMRLVEPKRLFHLCVGHRPHALAIEPPFVHVLRGLDDAHARGLEQCLDAGVCVGLRYARLECTE